MEPPPIRCRFRRHRIGAPRAFAQAPPSSRFIDSHVHVWKHDPAFPFAAGAHPSPENASAEMLLDLMHANDVARTVIIQVIHYKWDNSYLAQRAEAVSQARSTACAASIPKTLPRRTS